MMTPDITPAEPETIDPDTTPSEPAKRVTKKTAVITGITSDIGMAIGQALQDQGWEVMGLTHSDLDLAKPEDVAVAGDRLRTELPVIDALIHVAGIWHNGESPHVNKDLEDYSWQDISATMDVGVTSFMILTAKLLPILAKDGCVIGISGTFADGASGQMPYYVSKRALEDFIAGLAQDYPHGPNVYGISPADTATSAYSKHFPEHITVAQSPEVIGNLVATLVTPSDNYKSGGVIEIRDGHVASGFHS